MSPLAPFLLLAVAAAASAENLPDPTRPPSGYDAPTASVAGGPAPPPAPTGLQSIVRRAGAKPAAVINGAYVELGGRVGDAKLVKIGDDSVVLRSKAGHEVLRLTPGIEKTVEVRGAEGQAAARNKGGKAQQ